MLSKYKSHTMSLINYNLEYRSMKDDAWYTCAVVLETNPTRFRVKHKDYIQTYNDDLFSLSDFQTVDQLEAFARRFRLESVPVEDNECTKVTAGVMVCAAYTADKQRRYFDAVVDAVCYKEHTHETCSCTYLLFWQHGPEEGNTTATSLVNLYLIKPDYVDPTVAKFTKLVKNKLNPVFEFTLIPRNPLLSRKVVTNETISKSQEFGITGDSSQVAFSAGRGRYFPKLNDEDRDLGGAKESSSHHYILLENVENDLCSIKMMAFIYEETLITARTHVFPSFLGGTYARGAIMVDSRTQLKTIYEFINNPNHFIVSSSGRPWVIAEDKFRTGIFKKNLDSLRPEYENYKRKKDLKVVRLGTEEYTKAKQLKELYMEFRNHLNGLLQRLATEEEKNNQGAN